MQADPGHLGVRVVKSAGHGAELDPGLKEGEGQFDEQFDMRM